MMKKSIADLKTKITWISMRFTWLIVLQGKDACVLFMLNYLIYQPALALDVIQVDGNNFCYGKFSFLHVYYHSWTAS